MKARVLWQAESKVYVSFVCHACASRQLGLSPGQALGLEFIPATVKVTDLTTSKCLGHLESGVAAEAHRRVSAGELVMAEVKSPPCAVSSSGSSFNYDETVVRVWSEAFEVEEESGSEVLAPRDLEEVR